jgi:hypothetical protein
MRMNRDNMCNTRALTCGQSFQQKKTDSQCGARPALYCQSSVSVSCCLASTNSASSSTKNGRYALPALM